MKYGNLDFFYVKINIDFKLKTKRYSEGLGGFSLENWGFMRIRLAKQNLAEDQVTNRTTHLKRFILVILLNLHQGCSNVKLQFVMMELFDNKSRER